jgi:AcrR family transcriptional regulator
MRAVVDQRRTRRDVAMVNKHIPIVRERAGAAGATDRRVERTQQALTFALVELVPTKRWAKITVQDLLDRAGVGRSTFYAHYRSKDDLLLKSFVKMLDLMDAQLDRAGAGAAAGAGRVAAVAELFEHVGEVTAFHRALARAHVLERLFLAGSQHMSRHIERRLATLAGEGSSGGGAPSLAVAAQAHAGSLFALLRWWIDQAAPHTPEEMDRMFHALVHGGLRGR